MGYRIQNRRDTAARWAEINPILLEGEIGYVIDNPNQYKIGDGVSAWNSLPLRGFNGTIAPTLGYNDDAVPSQRVITERFDFQSEKLSELGSEVGVKYNIGWKSASASYDDKLYKHIITAYVSGTEIKSGAMSGSIALLYGSNDCETWEVVKIGTSANLETVESYVVPDGDYKYMLVNLESNGIIRYPYINVPDIYKKSIKELSNKVDETVYREKINSIVSDLDNLNGTKETTEADLDITDEHGNVLARFAKGGLRTKNFNSDECLNSDNSTNPTDLDITDEAKNILARFANGHIYTKYFNSEKVRKHGVIKSGDTITHFSLMGDGRYLCRQFGRGVIGNYYNGLIDLQKMYIAKMMQGSLVQVENIGTSSSDFVGPISICRGAEDNWIGQWSGGTHFVSVGGVDFRTADEVSYNLVVDNVQIKDDGLYYGDIIIISAKNNLYFPQTVTGQDLSNATLAICENRIYTLTDKLNVKIVLDFKEDVVVNKYMGTHVFPYNMTEVVLPNKGVVIPSFPTEKYVDDVVERKIILRNDDYIHEVDVKNYGLGTFDRYSDGKDENYGFLYIATFGKIYFSAISKSTAVVIKGGDLLVMETDYTYSKI